MNYRQLSYFIEIYKTGNIHIASKKLFVSRQALSQTIQKLEKELEKPLFIRNKNGVIPTEAAIQLFPHAERIIQEYQAIYHQKTLSELNKRVLTIYSFDGVFSYLTYKFVLEFNKQYPQILLNVVEATDQIADEMLRTNRCDFAIIPDSVDLSMFRTDVLFKANYCVLLYEGHPLCKKSIISSQDLSHQKFVGKGRGLLCYNRNMNQMMHTNGNPHIIFEQSSGSLIYDLVEKKEAISISWDYMLIPYLDKKIIIRPFENIDYGSNLYLASNRNADVTSDMYCFRNFLLEWIRSHHLESSRKVVCDLM